MNQLDQRDMQLHTTILGWLFIATHALLLLVAVGLFALLTGIGFAVHDREATVILSIVGSSMGAVMAVLALPGLVAGFGLLARKNWARFLALIVGVLGLVNFPIGTVIGIYALWVLLQRSADEYFGCCVPAGAASQSPAT